MDNNKQKEAFEKLKGFLERHKGYKLKASEIKTLQEMFNKYPEVLTYQDENGMNLGMWACEYKMEPIVLMALDDAEASIQQDKYGQNIGMFAAWKELEGASLKALDNVEASVQQEKSGWNIGMRAACKGMAKATAKALQNTQARKQKNVLNDTIESLAKENGLSGVVKKFYNSKHFSVEELNSTSEKL